MITITATPSGKHTHWLVALVEPQCEMRVRAWLQDEAGIPSWLPVSVTKRTRGGVKHVVVAVEKPLVRGYLFVPASFYDWHGLHNAKGIRGFMTYKIDGGQPRLAILLDRELGPLREFEANLAATSGQRKYRVDQAIRVTEGVFKGMEARIVALAGNDAVRVSLSIGVATIPEHAIEPAT